jgi:hypothetical protein
MFKKVIMWLISALTFIYKLIYTGLAELTISVDFDGTIVKDAFPACGKLRKLARPIMRWIAQRNHAIIINTCRIDEYKNWPAAKNAAYHAKSYLIAQDISFKYFNENRPDTIAKYGTDCRKISADIYIDDKNAGIWAWWMIPFVVIWCEYKKYRRENKESAHVEPSTPWPRV